MEVTWFDEAEAELNAMPTAEQQAMRNAIRKLQAATSGQLGFPPIAAR